MRAKKIDNNQNEIVTGMRQVPGVSVKITSALGDGFVDAVVGYKGVNYLMEIKDGKKPPSARKLTEEEQKFHRQWKGQVCIVESLEDALMVLGIKIAA